MCSTIIQRLFGYSFKCFLFVKIFHHYRLLLLTECLNIPPGKHIELEKKVKIIQNIYFEVTGVEECTMK